MKKNIKILTVLITLFFTFNLTMRAQTASVAQIKPEAETTSSQKSLTDDETQTRVKHLESQVQTMQAEIELLNR